MKTIKSFLILLMLISSIGIVSAEPIVVSTKVVWYESPLYFIGVGDYIEAQTYSDGYVKNVMYRAGSIFKTAEILGTTPTVEVTQGSTSIPIQYQLKGMYCSLTAYSVHRTYWYIGSTSGTLLGSQSEGNINCGDYKTFNYNVPASGYLNTVGNFNLIMEEVSMKSTFYTVVYETRIIPVRVIASSTPPSPISTMGTMKINSIPTGATVRINSVYKGVTPLTLSLSEAEYIVEVSKNGYQTQSRTQSVYSGYSTDITFSLTLVSVPTPVYTTPQPTYTTQPTVTGIQLPTYVCPDKSIVSDPTLCFKSEEQKIKIIPKPIADILGIKETPGFEILFAIVGIIGVFLLRRKI